MPKFDQHFLIDKNIVKKIVSAAEFKKEDIVIEIGPGKGILTETIAALVGYIFAIEIDSELVNLLKTKLRNYTNIEIINSDFLKVDLTTLKPPQKFFKQPLKYKIVGNIPYSITTAIIEKIFGFTQWELAVLMVQKEVAERMLAGQNNSNTKSFSRLTLWTNFYSKIQPVCKVSHKCFLPSPQVDSFVIKLVPNFEYADFKYKELLFKIITYAFSQRRKKLINSLSSNLKISKEKMTKICIKSDIGIDSRPEELNLEKFLILTENIAKFINNPQNC